MVCHVCGAQAVGQCKACLKFYCANHGDVRCAACREAERRPATAEPADEEELGDFLTTLHDSGDTENPYRSPMAELSPHPRAPVNRNPKPAGFWIRVGASLVDTLVMVPLIVLSFVALAYHNAYLLILANLPALVYKPFMEAKYGATIGKMACGLAVEDAKHQRLSLAAAYVRFLPALVYSIICLGEVVYTMAYPWHPGRYPYRADYNTWALLRFGTGLFYLIDCVAVVFSDQKLAFHDLLADSSCVYVSASLDSIRSNDKRDVLAYLDELEPSRES